MFFRKKEPSHSIKLIDIVKKTNQTGYVFGNISNDLGVAAERIMRNQPLIIMAYGYVRRAAAAALYVQGVFDKDGYDYVTSMFKSLQAQTVHTVEFQEMAASHSIEFMQTYSNSINGLFVKKIVSISLKYEISSERIADENLFQSVIETIRAEEIELQQKQTMIMKSNIFLKNNRH